ncbi:Co-chaperone protein HscB [Candidatus Kinetoplastibacterium sorsogonicusi]|uniref:Co-chaperone protein HscB n=1 Tax=Candidatus Kinetoplastidibacterium kentomonadis TaxID=1576550 RepID=A0A3Q8ER68_9PROT|nr:Fe-S protein assembly co-chaperone HscB [Candidatus Kinetoplastibacterium sorsogonicusi]AWD32363.1 Co-chaperone protein HscB [Candidatus Kinetoplastibacterium sorsogonicusi]
MLNINYFSLFGLEKKFNIDLVNLKNRWMSMIKNIHPDSFANLSDIEQKLSLEYSAYINQAYFELLNPIKRATYICNENNVNVESISLSKDFLEQQMVWMEQLSSNDNVIIQNLYNNLKKIYDIRLLELGNILDSDKNYYLAGSKLSEFIFIDKLLHKIIHRLN